MSKLLTYALVAVFGSSSWLGTNAVWMQLSLMVPSLPEGWTLPSYLTVAIQISCVGPIAYSILLKMTSLKLPKAVLIESLLLFCTACCLVLAFWWHITVPLFGTSHSVVLIAATFGIAIMNALSNVLFMPFMASFQPQYLTAYFVGMGLSAFVPSIFSLIQGTGEYECKFNPTTGETEAHYLSARFSVRTFFLIMAAWMALTALAFGYLQWSKRLRDHKRGNRVAEVAETPETHSLHCQDGPSANEEGLSGLWRYVLLLLCIAYTCAVMNGVVPSIQSYASLSYSQLTYHLALSLDNFAQAVASFVPLWVKPRSLLLLMALVLAASGFCAYTMMLALQSPHPVLQHSGWGSFLSVMASIGAAALNAFNRTVLTTVVREDNPDNESRLFWCGVFMQIGSFVGTTVMFPLVNVANVFQAAIPCSEG